MMLKAPFDLSTVNPANPSPGIWECPAEPTTSEPDPRFIPVTAYGEVDQPVTTWIVDNTGGHVAVYKRHDYADGTHGYDMMFRPYSRRYATTTERECYTREAQTVADRMNAR